MTDTSKDVEQYRAVELLDFTAQYPNEVWVRHSDYAALAAQLEAANALANALHCAQPYQYIGKDGKSILARELEGQLEAAKSGEATARGLMRKAFEANQSMQMERDAANARAKRYRHVWDRTDANLQAANVRIFDLEFAAKEAVAQARDDALAEAMAACEAQKVHFLSPEYATHQPLSSHSERFACGVCTAAIQALRTRPTHSVKPVTVQEAAKVLHLALTEASPLDNLIQTAMDRAAFTDGKSEWVFNFRAALRAIAEAKP